MKLVTGGGVCTKHTLNNTNHHIKILNFVLPSFLENLKLVYGTSECWSIFFLGTIMYQAIKIKINVK